MGPPGMGPPGMGPPGMGQSIAPGCSAKGAVQLLMCKRISTQCVCVYRHIDIDIDIYICAVKLLTGPRLGAFLMVTNWAT